LYVIPRESYERETLFTTEKITVGVTIITIMAIIIVIIIIIKIRTKYN
jgi:hypothetical protein